MNCGCGYEDVERMMTPHTQNPYPTWTYTRDEDVQQAAYTPRRGKCRGTLQQIPVARAKNPVDVHPWAEQYLEVRPEPNLGRSRQNGSVVDVHRIEGATLDPGRVLTHPSRIVAPLLIDSNQPQTFDVPAKIIQWAPNPIVQRSFGQQTLAPDDMRHVVPKQLLGYSYNALSQQEIADQAALRVRRSLYGR